MTAPQLPAALVHLARDPKVLEALAREATKQLQFRKLETYRPYAKQKAFLDAGGTGGPAGRGYRMRAFMAGNQQGKTMAGCVETCFHLLGDYPDWWRGRRWDRPVNGWAIGVTAESVRDTLARLILGRAGQQGTGLLPRDRIISVTNQRGVAEAPDTLSVRHANGGVSTLSFKSYAAGVAKLMGETLDFVHLDESPPEDIWSECLGRIIATNGMVYLTLSPIEGLTPVVERFYPEPKTIDACLVRSEIEDALHIPPEQRQAIIDGFAAHEREARVRGIPTMGSGRVFPLTEESIVVEPFQIPKYWPQIAGLDLGWEHPTAACRMAHDRENDIVYVTATYRVKEQTPVIHAGALRAWGPIPFAWPHDALSHDKGSGQTFASIYRDQGLNMLPERATWEDGGSGVEAGIAHMLDRFSTGRLRVFSTCTEFLEEFRNYHRKNGVLFKLRDDVLSACRYGLSMLRYAETGSGHAGKPLRRNIRIV